MKNRNRQLILISLIIFQFCIPFPTYSLILKDRDVFDSMKSNPSASDIDVEGYTIPGISVSIPRSQVLKIGILDDMGHISGESAWKGAMLAAREINEAGGININGSIFYIGLVSEDTEEADNNLNVSKGVQAANRMINNHNPHFVTGGFRTESLLAYQEIIMDAQIPFLSTGVSTETFTDNVRTWYSRYKYFFRIMPLNNTGLAISLLYYYTQLANYFKATYNVTTLKFAILREDLSWTGPFAAALEAYLPLFYPGTIIVANIAFPITLSATDMLTHLTNLQTVGAQIVIPLISGQAGILMSNQYAAIQPNFLIAGLNAFAQHNSYWDYTGGSCDYEVVVQDLYNSSKTSKTRPFWDRYLNEYGEEPYYTGAGSYDAINLLANSVYDKQSFNADVIVSELEKTNITNPFTGVSNKIAFTMSHDLMAGWPYATTLFCQWFSASKTVLSTSNMIYPESIPTGFLKLPPWGIQGFGYSQLPRDFTLTSDADNPDTNGAFNLTWTISTGADSYSIYKSKDPITYPNNGLTIVADKTAVSPFQISGLKTGNHYFVIVAQNGSGIKMSNCIRVSVLQEAPGDFILVTDADTPDMDGVFNLIWTASDGADNYSVYTSNNFITKINSSINLLAYQNAVSPFLVSNRKTGDNYFVVVAHNGTGNTMSECILIDVQLPTPGAFTLTSDADDPDPDGAFSLVWTNSEGVDNYSVYIHNLFIAEINGSIALLKYQTAISPFPISVLPDGEYYFVVVAHNGTGYSMSNCIHITVQYLPPSAFSLNTDADDPDFDGIFNLIWTDSNGADNYSIYMHSSPISIIDGSQTLLNYQNAISPFPVMGLKNGEYYFVVVAHNEIGDTLSNNVLVSVQLPPPGPFTLINDANDPDSDGIFYLSWTDSVGADNYSVYKYTSSIVEINTSVTLLADQRALSPYLVYESSDGKFYYVVVAYNETGQTMSNNVRVFVRFPEERTQIPGYNLMFVIGVAFTVSLILLKRSRKR
ncbi:MAG: ABC transporter substrate-binding protein [Candidatus Thorarchaeota archaeon]